MLGILLNFPTKGLVYPVGIFSITFYNSCAFPDIEYLTLFKENTLKAIPGLSVMADRARQIQLSGSCKKRREFLKIIRNSLRHFREEGYKNFDPFGKTLREGGEIREDHDDNLSEIFRGPRAVNLSSKTD